MGREDHGEAMSPEAGAAMAGGRSAVSDDAMDRFVFGVDQENILTAWIFFSF